MKKILAFCLIFSIMACDDGDLQIEVLDFDESSIQHCETISLDTRIFFKINDDEALILNLQSGLLKNEVSDGTITSTIPSQSKITYRIFTDKVSKDYFCSEVPLTEPAVADELEAEGGEVLITTVLAEDGESYEHKIELSGISLVTEDGSRITDLRINDFGTVTTKDDLQIKVLDFDDSSIQYCETISLATRIFFKINDDDALILNLQSGLLKNEVSDGTITSTVPEQSKITYRIFTDKVSNDYFCSEIPLTEPAVADELEAEGGEVLITTVLAEDGESYEHKIELSDILVTQDGSPITDLKINDFGTVTTIIDN